MTLVWIIAVYLAIAMVFMLMMEDAAGFFWPVMLITLMGLGIATVYNWVKSKSIFKSNPFVKEKPEPHDIAAGLVEQALIQYPDKWVDIKGQGYEFCYEFKHKNIKVVVRKLRWGHEIDAYATLGGQPVELNVIKFYEMYKEREAARKEYEKKHAYLDAIEEYLK